MIIFLKTFLGICLMMAAWVLIQRFWLADFPTRDGESDALACRGGCGRCSGKCEEKSSPSNQEVSHG